MRTLNSVKTNKVRQVGDLRGLTDSQIMSWPNFGEASLTNLKETLAKLTSKTDLGGSRLLDVSSTASMTVGQLLKQLSPESLEIPFRKLSDLAKRTSEGLDRHSITQVGDLRGLTDSEILSWKNFGSKSLANLKVCLGSLPRLEAGESLDSFDRRQLLQRTLLEVIESCMEWERNLYGAGQTDR